ncbi:hypothetical protein BBP40_009239 [Aspergillus hancockii]|nr:hypothetical protein BBP40_009239 [Aspergillus hancockii]
MTVQQATALQKPKPKASLIQQFSNFTRTSVGLEKTLRLIQALAQITVELEIDPTSTTRWATAKSQLALTRRYFRFFAFIDCFTRVYGLLGGRDESQGLLMSGIEIGRFSCLGLYFVLEDLTILHAMNVHPVSWNKPVLIEAYKFWFYALALSILGAVLGLLFTPASSTISKVGNDEKETPKKKAGKAGKAPIPENKAERTALMKRIVVDGCDLLIPGASPYLKGATKPPDSDPPNKGPPGTEINKPRLLLALYARPKHPESYHCALLISPKIETTPSKKRLSAFKYHIRNTIANINDQLSELWRFERDVVENLNQEPRLLVCVVIGKVLLQESA